MSFDRPGLPHPGRKAEELAIDEALADEGVELTDDGELEGLDHPGAPSPGPQPNPPRRPNQTAASADQDETPPSAD